MKLVLLSGVCVCECVCVGALGKLEGFVRDSVHAYRFRRDPRLVRWKLWGPAFPPRPLLTVSRCGRRTAGNKKGVF